MLDVRPGAPQSYKHLTIIPLLCDSEASLPYRLLADAMAAGQFRIIEKGSGTVPTLVALNSGQLDVLILDGEQLIGARQNRTTNRSMIVAAGSEVEIPVSCMEHGRWHHVSPQMAVKSDISPSNVRRHARNVEADHVRRRARVSANVLSEAQGAVWDEIAVYADKLGAHSPSGALDHVYDTHTSTISAWVNAFHREDRQVGLLAMIGDQPLGLDAVGCGKLYGQLHERLLHGYVLDALSSEPSSPTTAAERAAEYLRQVREAVRTPADSVGKGSYAVLTGAVVGGELVDGGRLVHLSAFPNVDVVSVDNPLAPPSRRRRR
ncbi:MAG TPA: DUF6569 family protein [Longimicrobiales bacterium]